MTWSTWLISLVLLGTLLVSPSRSTAQADPAVEVGDAVRVEEFAATDSLTSPAGVSAQAQECFDGLAWKAAPFTVQVEWKTPADFSEPDAIVRYPSPRPSGIEQNDRVVLEWYAARDDAGKIRTRPLVVVVHESGTGMVIGRLFARGLRAQGYHAAMLQLPFYGERRPKNHPHDAAAMLTGVPQAAADVRRARDAVAVLPHVDKTHIALQGTSLGGFVAATTAGLDDAYSSTFLMVAGGNLEYVIEHGEREAATFRKILQRGGLSPQGIRDVMWKVEPLRRADLISAETCWLYSAEKDPVVPPRCSQELAEKIGLTPDHHVKLWADHHLAVLYFPVILNHMVRQLDRLTKK